MNPTVTDLMRSLVKRYHIPTRPSSTSPTYPQSTLSQPQTPLIHRPAAPQHRVQFLLQKLEGLQRQNESLRESLKAKDGELTGKRQQWAHIEQKWIEKEKSWELGARESKQRISQLQSHNDALQQELLSIKDLLREQEALILQLNASHEEDD